MFCGIGNEIELLVNEYVGSSTPFRVTVPWVEPKYEPETEIVCPDGTPLSDTD